MFGAFGEAEFFSRHFCFDVVFWDQHDQQTIQSAVFFWFPVFFFVLFEFELTFFLARMFSRVML